MIAVGLAVGAAVLVLRPPVRARAGVPATQTSALSAAAPSELSAVLLDVAAQVRAGAGASAAWEGVLQVSVPQGTPTVDQLMAATGTGARHGQGTGASARAVARRGAAVSSVPALLARRRRREGRATRARAAAVVVATTASHELGAPLAEVLHRLAAALVADEEAAAEISAAVAGPRATARVLAWLPVLGLAVSVLLGADPVGVMLSGGIGTTTAVLGLALLGAGRAWTKALLRRAMGPST